MERNFINASDTNSARVWMYRALKELNVPLVENLLLSLTGTKAKTTNRGRTIVLGDRTVVEKRRAEKLEYLGNGKKGKELWIYTFGLPFKGRVLPIQVSLYAPKPLTRNEEHMNFIEKLIEKVGRELVIVFDTELTYETMLHELNEAGISYVVPLKREVSLTDPESGESYSLRSLKEKVFQNGVME